MCRSCATVFALILCLVCREVQMVPLRAPGNYTSIADGSKYGEPVMALYECVKGGSPFRCYGVEANLVRSLLGNVQTSGNARDTEVSFNITALISMAGNESTVTVQVQVYKERITDQNVRALKNSGCDTSSVTVQLNAVAADGKVTRLRSSATLRIDDLKKDGWVTFENITDLYKMWIRSKIGGVQRLTLSAPIGCSSAWLGFVAPCAKGQRDPVLMAFLTDNHPARNIDAYSMSAVFRGFPQKIRAQRSEERQSDHECQLMPLQVDFADVRIDTRSIISDTKFDFNICDGACLVPSSSTTSRYTTRHATYLYFLRSRKNDERNFYPPVRCVPSSYIAASYVKDEKGVISIVTLDNATVTGCSCTG